jgi:putative PIN family toxin of toxin-antitoxin system
MPSIVFDASALVGALLKEGSVPERAFENARVEETICLSEAVEAELRDVFSRPKFKRYLSTGRGASMLALITLNARRVEPRDTIRDCRDPSDNKYLELALAAGATTIVSSDSDLLVLHPWRGIDILTPAQYLARATAADVS